MSSLDSTWAVWVDIWEPEDRPVPLPLETGLAELGYEPSPIPVACFDGSVEQLGLDPMVETWGSPLFFRTAEDAQAFTELWDQPSRGITEGSFACDWG